MNRNMNFEGAVFLLLTAALLVAGQTLASDTMGHKDLKLHVGNVVGFS